jgi:tRNA-dihydrouridine synthase 2
MSEKAMTARLKEIVECVKEMRDENGEPLDVAILANGDVEGLRDMERVRNISGADGVMIATKAEENPSCFMDPMAGFEELVVRYLRIVSQFLTVVKRSSYCFR